MLLTELHGYRQYADKTISQIVRTLQGFDVNTDGAYSFVMISRDQQHVYKVWGDDPGYEAYLEVVKRMQDNKYVPKLLSKVHKIPAFFKRPEKANGYIKIIKLEKLSQIKSTHFATLLSRFLNDLAETKIRFTGFNREHLKTEIKNFIKHTTSLKNYHRPDGPTHVRDEWTEITRELHDTSDDLFDIAIELNQLRKKTPGIDFDLGQANILFRGNQPVIIDPFQPSGELEDLTKNGVIIIGDYDVGHNDKHVTGQRPSIR